MLIFPSFKLFICFTFIIYTFQIYSVNSLVPNLRCIKHVKNWDVIDLNSVAVNPSFSLNSGGYVTFAGENKYVINICHPINQPCKHPVSKQTVYPYAAAFYTSDETQCTPLASDSFFQTLDIKFIRDEQPEMGVDLYYEGVPYANGRKRVLRFRINCDTKPFNSTTDYIRIQLYQTYEDVTTNSIVTFMGINHNGGCIQTIRNSTMVLIIFIIVGGSLCTLFTALICCVCTLGVTIGLTRYVAKRVKQQKIRKAEQLQREKVLSDVGADFEDDDDEKLLERAGIELSKEIDHEEEL